LDGKSRLIAHGWNPTVPSRADGAKYPLPIVGPFGTNSEARIIMSPSLDAPETLSLAGERLALDEQNGAAVLLWKVSFDAAVRDAILTDVEADRRLEIIVQADDGRVRILKPKR
jgi:hypothetical protein